LAARAQRRELADRGTRALVIAGAQVVGVRADSASERRMQLPRTAGALTDWREEPNADASHGQSLLCRGCAVAAIRSALGSLRRPDITEGAAFAASRDAAGLIRTPAPRRRNR
jgi:hypothetical protein